MLTHTHIEKTHTHIKFVDTEGCVFYASSRGGGGPPADSYNNRPEPLGGVRVSSPGKQHHRDRRAQQAIQTSKDKGDLYVLLKQKKLCLFFFQNI